MGETGGASVRHKRGYSRIPTGAYIPAGSRQGLEPVWYSSLESIHGEAPQEASRPVDVLIIGAGQNGLAMGYELLRQGLHGYMDKLGAGANLVSVQSDRAGHDQAGSDRAGEDRAGEDRVRADQAGSDHTGHDQVGDHHTGHDQTGSDRAGEDRGTSERVELDRTLSGQSAPARAALTASADLPNTGASTAVPTSSQSFLLLDAEVRPGGAWQHYWPSLRVADVERLPTLPRIRMGNIDPWEEAADVVPSYFADFEDYFDLPVLRPVMVRSVSEDPTPGLRLLRVATSIGLFHARVVVSCTGTWTRPFVPNYPGMADFRGQQYHTQDYPGPRYFEKQRVVVVGSGLSAQLHLADLDRVAKKLYWVARTPPVSSAEDGTDSLPRATSRNSPVSRKRRRPMFSRVEPYGVRWDDGSYLEADAIIWATGFRRELRHLAPLGLRSRGGGIVLEGSRVLSDPRVHILGNAPHRFSGPGRDGVEARRAAREIVAFLRSEVHA
ncbi:hypothetical protein EKN07_10700 [Actinobaculum sp. 352]|nr:hypothetical protein EKN07_10700 [Actinobaculum sp. 352]